MASIFAGAQLAPAQSLIVAIPANHSVAFDRVTARTPASETGELEVIVACAGQPLDRAAIHSNLRDAHFLLAPAETPLHELRRLAAAQATGDVLTFVDAYGARESEANGIRSGYVLERPALSVIIPLRNAAALVGETLEALVESSLPRQDYEIIVVDDGSADGGAAVAAQFADRLVRLTGAARGAAYARNRGAELALADTLVFVDAGVRVRRDTLGQMLALLHADETTAALGACNDGSSGDGGIPTQYWNLIQQHGAAAAAHSVIHFNASCGAIRRDAFAAVGGFDEWHYRGTSVEDLDLGDRLHRAGHRVELRPEIQFTSVRPHGLLSVLARTCRRSSLVTRLLGYGRTNELAQSHPVHALGSSNGLLAIAGIAAVGFAVRTPSPLAILLAVAAVAGIAYANSAMFRFLLRRRGLTFAVAALPLHVATQIAVALGRVAGWIMRNVIGNPAPDATTQAFAEVGVTMWPPVPRRP